jgi:hypothetical protein
MSLNERIENDFVYHAPTEGQPEKYEYIRKSALFLARDLLTMVPEGRELSTALTKLDEVVFWANAGIARNEV